jgi:predicted glycoside hydrolase/deacetylase ChbG (UPF0249 family)
VTGFLVVNADDVGVSIGATLGAKRAHLEGVLTSASMCVTTPAYAHALESLRECPRLGIGLHLSLTLGSPAADVSRVPLLVDGAGRFRWSFGSLLAAMASPGRRDLLAQIAIEIEAQFQQLTVAGIHADHVNGERHVHLIPGVLEAVVEAARRHNVRFVRAGSEGGRAYGNLANAFAAVANGGIVKSAILSSLAARARTLLHGDLATPDRVVSYMFTGRADLMLPGLLAHDDGGVTEVMLHPGVPARNGTLGAEYRGIANYLMSPDRERELDACIAARAQPTTWTLATFAQLAASRP